MLLLNGVAWSGVNVLAEKRMELANRSENLVEICVVCVDIEFVAKRLPRKNGAIANSTGAAM